MNNSTFSEFKFGKNLRFLRKHNKITLVELSESIDIGKSTLSDYENNKTLASIDAIIKVSLYFNISIDVLIIPIYRNCISIKRI
jgi:transcriptional regulator with XRE-family HTH domain